MMLCSKCMSVVCICLAIAGSAVTVASEADCEGHAICQSLAPELPDAPEQDQTPAANLRPLTPATASTTAPLRSTTITGGKPTIYRLSR